MSIFFDYILGRLRLRDAPAGSNQRTMSYTVGIFGAAGCDYNFASAANANKQSIQLGAAAIIPADSPITSIVGKCTEAILEGALLNPTTALCDVGSAAGTDEHISGVALETLNQERSVSQQIEAVAVASSVYFSITPGANWNTLHAGKWKVRITINDNSLN